MSETRLEPCTLCCGERQLCTTLDHSAMGAASNVLRCGASFNRNRNGQENKAKEEENEGEESLLQNIVLQLQYGNKRWEFSLERACKEVDN